MENPSVPPLVNPEVGERIRKWRGYFDAKLGFRNHWYPMLTADELEEGKPIAFRLARENLLLNRIDGKVYAMKDQCLHRGATLCRPERGNRKNHACTYHDWAFWEKPCQGLKIKSKDSS